MHGTLPLENGAPVSIRTAAALMAALLALGASACGSDGSSSDGPPDGARDRAVLLFTEIGIADDDAACLVDALGVDTVIEAPDVAVLADGQPYKDAAEECLS